MRTITDLGLVRVISLDADPRLGGNNVIVQVRDGSDSEWQFHEGFNSMSDDYAYTNARDAAFALVRMLARDRASNFA